MLTAPPDLLKVPILRKLLEQNGLDRLVQPERLLDLHPHSQDQPRCSQPTECSEEEILVLISRDGNDRGVCCDEGDRED